MRSHSRTRHNIFYVKINTLYIYMYCKIVVDDQHCKIGYSYLTHVNFVARYFISFPRSNSCIQQFFSSKNENNSINFSLFNYILVILFTCFFPLSFIFRVYSPFRIETKKNSSGDESKSEFKKSEQKRNAQKKKKNTNVFFSAHPLKVNFS